MRNRTRTLLRTTSIAAAALLLLPASLLPGARAAAPSPPTLRAQVLADTREGIFKMVYKTSSQDTQYIAGQRFRFAGVPCLRCELGPAVAAAALYRRTGDPVMRQLALRVMDTAIQNNRQADGSWGPPDAPGRASDVDTIFFAEHLGMMLYSFGATVDAEHRRRYTTVLKQAVDTLVARDVHVYYSNGNINLAATVAIGMAWKLSGESRYQVLYDRALRFTLAPGPEWPGYGLRLTTVGTKSLGRDSAGYLAEGNGRSRLGYDTGYTAFQADFAAAGYLVTRDPRLLTLANQLNNQLLYRVDPATWYIDLAGGTRTVPGNYRYGPFTTPALLVSAQNGRPELAAWSVTQTRAAVAYFDATADHSWNGIYQSWGTQMASFIMTVP